MFHLALTCIPLTAIVMLDFHLNSGYIFFFPKTLIIFMDEKKIILPNINVLLTEQKLFFMKMH